jgi:hypothetical protein
MVNYEWLLLMANFTNLVRQTYQTLFLARIETAPHIELFGESGV